MSYFIKVNDIFYFLDSTTSISVEYPAKATELPIHSKRTVSDHYFTEQPKMSINGIVSDIKSARSNDPEMSSSDYIDGLRRAMLSGTPLRVKYRLDKEEEGGWFITNLNPQQDQQNGFGGTRRVMDPEGFMIENVIQSFKVQIQLKKIEYAEGSTTEVDVPQAYKDALQSKGNKTSSTQTFGETSGERKKEEDTYAGLKNAWNMAGHAGRAAITGQTPEIFEDEEEQ